MFTGVFSGYSIDDVEAAKQFYSDVLECEVTDTMGGLYLGLPGNQRVFLYPKENHLPATYTVLNFEVTDIDVAVDELMGRGVDFLRYTNLPAQQDERGILRGRAAGRGPDIAWFKDPAGNILSVIQEEDM